jgi:hypothetical protein
MPKACGHAGAAWHAIGWQDMHRTAHAFNQRTQVVEHIVHTRVRKIGGIDAPSRRVDAPSHLSLGLDQQRCHPTRHGGMGDL